MCALAFLLLIKFCGYESAWAHPVRLRHSYHMRTVVEGEVHSPSAHHLTQLYKRQALRCCICVSTAHLLTCSCPAAWPVLFVQGYSAVWNEYHTVLTCVPEDTSRNGAYMRTAVIVGCIAGACPALSILAVAGSAFE